MFYYKAFVKVPVIKKIVFFALMSLPFMVLAQAGKDGNKNINVTTYVNEYTVLVSNAYAGSSAINVASSLLNNNNRFSGNLATGDLLFIIQVQGAVIDNSDNKFYGEITDYNTCGNYEFAEVKSVVDAYHIELSCPLQNNYSSAGKTVVVRVPRFLSLTVGNGGMLTCDYWNGSAGGILVAEVSGNMTVNSGGVIDVSGKGFRGGIKCDTVSDWGVGNYRWDFKTRGAEKGESVAGYQNDYDFIFGRYCQGAPANGGGGGNAHNAGGGGGANGGVLSSWTGMGNPDISTSSWINAWELEIAGFSSSVSSGGGKGGYTFSSADLNALAEGPNGLAGNSNWGGDWRRATGGIGGRPLDYSSGKLFMGGGGGAGDENEGYGGSGGNAAGLIYFYVKGNVAGNGVINANGANGENAAGSQPLSGTTGTDAAGGGGAGGTVIINAAGNISSGISIYANGGNGGNQIIKKGLFNSSTEAEGPGGGGGGGYIAVSSGNPLKQTAGGVNGTTNSSGLTEFPPNGATGGGYGTGNAVISDFNLSVVNDTVCIGQSAMLVAYLSGNIPPGISVEWFDQPAGGNVISSGDTLFVASVNATETYWASTCPGFSRMSASVVVSQPAAYAGKDTAICADNSVQLDASGGLYCEWNQDNALNNLYIYNPVAAPLNSHYFVVTVYDEFGCTSVDSVFVAVNSNPVADAGNDTAVCAGSKVMLNASGGVSYHWAPAAYLDNEYASDPVADVMSNSIYVVTVTDANSCFDIDTVVLNALPLPAVNLGADTAVCTGDTITLNAGSEAMIYLWNTGNTTNIISASENGIYSVSVTDANSCTGYDSISVNVLPLPNSSINDVAPVCYDAAPFVLTSATTGGIWYGQGITNALSGEFNPASAGYGSHLITYVIPGTCSSQDTSVVEVYDCPGLHIAVPDIFSPNNDGQNDVLFVRGYGIEKINFVIYNRWGKKLFESDSQSEGWDGFSDGIMQNEGIYIYYIDALLSDGENVKQSGTVTLVR